MRYDKHKLIRFTGVPLNMSKVECGDYIKNKHSGLKQNNVPQGWARISAGKRQTRVASFFLC